MRILVYILLIFSVANLGFAQKAKYAFEYHLGLADNIPAPLTIYQQNEETIKLNAIFSSEPLQVPLYWQFRFSRWKNENSWEFEAIHHKLYLYQRPPEIQNFSISHGYNILSILRSKKVTLFNNFACNVRYGLGTALAHPENTVRGKRLNQTGGILESGYYISGPVLNLSLGKQINFSDRLFSNLELKFYPSRAKVPVANGYAIVWNVPIAFIFGIGINYIK